MSTTETALTAHLVLKDKSEVGNDLIKRANDGLHDNFKIVHTTLQLEYGEPVDPCGQASAEVV